MKKSIILTLSLCLASILSFGQTKPEAKKDTTIQVIMHINQYRALLYSIDANIDSKKVTKELLEFLQKSARMVQPAEEVKKIKK